jgi:hypothetical protein
MKKFKLPRTMKEIKGTHHIDEDGKRYPIYTWKDKTFARLH